MKQDQKALILNNVEYSVGAFKGLKFLVLWTN